MAEYRFMLLFPPADTNIELGIGFDESLDIQRFINKVNLPHLIFQY